MKQFLLIQKPDLTYDIISISYKNDVRNISVLANNIRSDIVDALVELVVNNSIDEENKDLNRVFG